MNLLTSAPLMTDKRISEEQVRHVARLACLALDDGEIRALSRQLGSILDYFATLDDLDLEGVEPTHHPIVLATAPRNDIVVPSLPRDVFLAAAPEQDAGGFAVPRVLDGEG